MFSTILIDGVVKLVKFVRYSNKPAVARIYDADNTKVPCKVLQGSSNDPDRFIDDVDCREYRSTQTGMVAV